MTIHRDKPLSDTGKERLFDLISHLQNFLRDRGVSPDLIYTVQGHRIPSIKEETPILACLTSKRRGHMGFWTRLATIRVTIRFDLVIHLAPRLCFMDKAELLRTRTRQSHCS